MERLPTNILEAFPHDVAIALEAIETSCTLAPRETKGQMRYIALSKMHTRTNYSTTSSASCGRLVGWLKVQRYTGWTVPATLLASAGGWCSCTCPIRDLISEYQICTFCYSVPDKGAEYCDDRVCLSVCLFVGPRAYLWHYASDLHQIICASYLWLWWRSDMLCVSGVIWRHICT